jgi:hypothetical protein
MKRALWIVSLLAVVALGAAIVGQALVVIMGVTYTPEGTPVDPTPQAVVVGDLATFGGVLALPLAMATFVLGVVATAEDRRYGWLAAMVTAGVVAFVGLVGMAWVILSANSPVAFQTPLAVIPLVTLLYSLVATPRRLPVPNHNT